MNILIAEKLHDIGVIELRKAGFTADTKYGLSREQLLESIKNYNAIIVRSKTQVDRELIDNAPNLIAIGRAGTGVNNIDLKAATKKGIFVTNCPGGNTISAAEHTIAMLFALHRNIPQANSSLKSGKWEKSKFIGTEIYGKTLGIIGLGKIGMHVAKSTLGFGMKVIGFDPYVNKEYTDKLGIKLVKLDDLVSKSDIITVHVPLTNDTKNLINLTDIKKMKPTARIINCARGGIINEDDLYQALKDHVIHSAALDVFTSEPAIDNILLSLPNVIVTPHLGASTKEAQEKVALQIADNIIGILSQAKYQNIVNMHGQANVPENIKPYAKLGFNIGRLHSEIVKGNVKSIEIKCSGDLCAFSESIKLHSLVGFMQDATTENLNLVNVMEVLSDRGINVIESKKCKMGDFKNSITIKVNTSEKGNEIKGVIFGTRYQRIIKINEFILDFYPEGNLLLIKNHDVPGVIAQISKLLGDNNINIAEWRTGRNIDSKIALAAVNLDNRVDDKIVSEIKKIKEVIDIYKINLGDK